jgi:ankyrin repeat protein
MNTAIKHPLHLPGTPQEGNLSVAQKLQIESIQGNIKKIVWVIGDAIENLKENQRKIEEIAVACEQSWNNNLAPFGSLIRQSWNVNEKDEHDTTILMSACSLYSASGDGFPDLVKLLLAHPHALVNEIDSTGWTAFMSAAFNDFDEITKLLLADPRLDLKTHNLWKKVLEWVQDPEIRSLIEAKMREQRIEF